MKQIELRKIRSNVKTTYSTPAIDCQSECVWAPQLKIKEDVKTSVSVFEV